MAKRIITTIYSNAIHNEQILCAAKVWAEENNYDFILRCHKHNNPYYITIVHIECHGLKMLFDMSDSAEPVNVTESIDVYFKRSFISEKIPFGLPYKVKPFGFNYGVTYKPFSLQRAVAFGVNKVYTVRSIPVLASQVNLSYKYIDYRNLHSVPRDNGGNILFLTRLWDPSNVRTPEKKTFREHLNHIRIDTVRRLKRQYRDRLIAGIEATPLACTLCPDLIVDKSTSSKKNYLKLLQNADVCIATNGLENTLGWRIAEYVAFSKAVVSEPFDVTVPGWKEEEHYLIFKDNLCEQIDTLLYQGEYRQMQENNHEYYKQYLAPAALFTRMLQQATSIN